MRRGAQLEFWLSVEKHIHQSYYIFWAHWPFFSFKHSWTNSFYLSCQSKVNNWCAEGSEVKCLNSFAWEEGLWLSENQQVCRTMQKQYLSYSLHLYFHQTKVCTSRYFLVHKTGFLTGVMRRVQLTEQDEHMFLEHPSLCPVWSGVCVSQSLIFCVVICWTLFVFSSFGHFSVCPSTYIKASYVLSFWNI